MGQKKPQPTADADFYKSLIRTLIYVLVVFGFLLHAETAFIESPGAASMSLVLLLWSFLPYALILLFRKFLYGSLCASATVFLFDFFLHLEVFGDAEVSASAMKLMGMPLWNTILVLPLSYILGAVVGMIVGKK